MAEDNVYLGTIEQVSTVHSKAEDIAYNPVQGHIVYINDKDDSDWHFSVTSLDDPDTQLQEEDINFFVGVVGTTDTSTSNHALETELIAYSAADDCIYVASNWAGGVSTAIPGLWKLSWNGSEYAFDDFVELPYTTNPGDIVNPQGLTAMDDGTLLMGDDTATSPGNGSAAANSMDVYEYTPNFSTGGTFGSSDYTFTFTVDTGTYARGYSLASHGTMVWALGYEDVGSGGAGDIREILTVDWAGKVPSTTYDFRDTAYDAITKPRGLEYIDNMFYVIENGTNDSGASDALSKFWIPQKSKPQDAYIGRYHSSFITAPSTTATIVNRSHSCSIERGFTAPIGKVSVIKEAGAAGSSDSTGNPKQAQVHLYPATKTINNSYRVEDGSSPIWTSDFIHLPLKTRGASPYTYVCVREASYTLIPGNDYVAVFSATGGGASGNEAFLEYDSGSILNGAKWNTNETSPVGPPDPWVTASEIVSNDYAFWLGVRITNSSEGGGGGTNKIIGSFIS